MSFDVVGGGGTAGYVLAARLSEKPDRRVCLLAAGPDYGSLDGGRWPPEILDARVMPLTRDWGTAGVDERSRGARIIGGSSSHNACMAVAGSPADDEWRPASAYDRFAPYLDRARAQMSLGAVPRGHHRSRARVRPLRGHVMLKAASSRCPAGRRSATTSIRRAHAPWGRSSTSAAASSGSEDLLVADASIMPTLPRANTNLTTAAIAERIAETL